MLTVNIKSYRKNANLTQSEVAAMMNVSRESVNEWENGKRMPGLAEADALASILNVSIYDLWIDMKSSKYEERKIEDASHEAVNEAIDKIIANALN